MSCCWNRIIFTQYCARSEFLLFGERFLEHGVPERRGHPRGPVAAPSSASARLCVCVPMLPGLSQHPGDRIVAELGSWCQWESSGSSHGKGQVTANQEEVCKISG